MQQFKPGIRDAFVPVEEALRETFLPDLFQGPGEGTPGREVTRLPMIHTGQSLPNPTKMAPENWTVSCVITGQLVTVLRVQEEFRVVDHSA